MRAKQQQAHLATFLKDFLGGIPLAVADMWSILRRHEASPRSESSMPTADLTDLQHAVLRFART
jgi:hypothetical protein